MTSMDVETVSWMRLILAFSVVFALLAGLGFVLKFVKARGLVLPGLGPNTQRRLQIIETLPLDVRRRLVIIRCDDDEHLLLLGPDHDIIVKNHLNENQPSSMRIKSVK